MERTKRETAIRGVAANIALQVIGANPAMSRAAVIFRMRRCRYLRRNNDQRSPIDRDPELVRQSAGRADRQIRLRTLEIDRDRELTFDIFESRRAFDREIAVSNIWRSARTPSKHPSNSREMFSPEKYFTINNERRYAEDSRVEGIALDIVM